MIYFLQLRNTLPSHALSMGALLMILFSGAAPVNAGVYKWTDENGNVIYGDKPPSSDASEVRIKKAPAADGDYNERLMKRKKILDVFQEERQQKKDEQQKLAAEKAEQKKQCARLIAELRDMQNASFLYEDTDDPFNPRIVSDEERQQEQKKYQDYINKNCK